MAGIQRFEDLEAWRQARQLASSIYTLTAEGGLARDYGLRDQMRRAAVSVMSNIAEGFDRGGDVEFRRFLSIAKGSAAEVKAQLYIALDIGFIRQDQFDIASRQIDSVVSLIAGLIRHLTRKSQLDK